MRWALNYPSWTVELLGSGQQPSSRVPSIVKSSNRFQLYARAQGFYFKLRGRHPQARDQYSRLSQRLSVRDEILYTEHIEEITPKLLMQRTGSIPRTTQLAVPEQCHEQSRRTALAHRPDINYCALHALLRTQRSVQCLTGFAWLLLFATDAAKRSAGALHRLGLSIAYETVIRALRDNSNASHRKLLEAVRQRQSFVSFGNTNPYRNVGDQCQHNRRHLVSYTVGYMCLADCSKEECSAECDRLPVRSIRYSTAVKGLSYAGTPDMWDCYCCF